MVGQEREGAQWGYRDLGGGTGERGVYRGLGGGTGGRGGTVGV